MMERTVLFYDFHRQYRMPRSQNVLRLGQNRSLGPTGPISSGGPSGYAMRGSANRAGCMRSEEHTSELQSLMRISYAVFCLKKKTRKKKDNDTQKTKTQKHDRTTRKTAQESELH